jgi:hypothetical protein
MNESGIPDPEELEEDEETRRKKVKGNPGAVVGRLAYPLCV